VAKGASETGTTIPGGVMATTVAPEGEDLETPTTGMTGIIATMGNNPETRSLKENQLRRTSLLNTQM